MFPIFQVHILFLAGSGWASSNVSYVLASSKQTERILSFSSLMLNLSFLHSGRCPHKSLATSHGLAKRLLPDVSKSRTCCPDTKVLCNIFERPCHTTFSVLAFCMYSLDVLRHRICQYLSLFLNQRNWLRNLVRSQRMTEEWVASL